MLSIREIDYYIPPNRLDPVIDCESFAISKSEGKVYSRIYGINEIPFAGDMSIDEMLAKSVESLLSKSPELKDKIRYLIHPYTPSAVSPMGHSVVRELAKKIDLSPSNAFATSINKCVSIYSALEMASSLINELEPDELILIATSEVGFTPELRVIPNTSITGDASACLLVGKANGQRELLDCITKVHGEFAKGIWMDAKETEKFEKNFIKIFTSCIAELLEKNQIDFNKVKLLLPHNVNYPTWVKVAKELNFPIDKVYLDNVKRYAHCFNSDLAINLKNAEDDGLLNSGDLFIAAAAGVGTVCSAALFRY